MIQNDLLYESLFILVSFLKLEKVEKIEELLLNDFHMNLFVEKVAHRKPIYHATLSYIINFPHKEKEVIWLRSIEKYNIEKLHSLLKKSDSKSPSLFFHKTNQPIKFIQLKLKQSIDESISLTFQPQNPLKLIDFIVEKEEVFYLHKWDFFLLNREPITSEN